jgi:hypothetical protein
MSRTHSAPEDRPGDSITAGDQSDANAPIRYPDQFATAGAIRRDEREAAGVADHIWTCEEIAALLD